MEKNLTKIVDKAKRTRERPTDPIASSSKNEVLLKILAELNALLGKNFSFEEFCSRVSLILKQKFHFKYIDIWVRDEKNSETLVLATREEVNGFRTTTINLGIVGKVIREGRTICAPNVLLHPDYHNVHREIASELCVPLMSEQHSIGVLNIETEFPTDFEAELPIIESIAEHLSHALKLKLLFQTEKRFHKLIDTMSEGLWTGDKDENTLYTNPTLQKLSGYSEQELLNMKSYDLFDGPSKKKIREETLKRKEGISSHYELVMITKSGEQAPMIVHASPFENEGTMAMMMDLRDIKKAEQKLAEVERYLASITKYSHEAIVGFDENCNIMSWNVGAQQMFGYRAQEMIGGSTRLMIPEDRLVSEELEHIMAEARHKGFLGNFETVRLHKNGTPIQISLTVSSLRDESGNVVGFSGIYRDITAQKKWERELQERFEKMQEAYREMGRQRRHLDYLSDITDMITDGAHSAKHIATFAVNALSMISKVDAVTLRTLDTASGKLVLQAHTGLSEEWWSKKIIPYQGSLLENAVVHKMPLKILDIVSEPRYNSRSLARKNNIRSALVIPLMVNNEVIGSITLYLTHDGNLSLLDDEFIVVFAKQASVALKMSK